MKEVPCFLCKDKKKPDPKCKACKGKGKLKLEFAPQEGLEYLSMFTERVLDALKEATGIRPFFTSDESSIGDFELEEKDLKKMSELLGVLVKSDDLLIDIAKRMKDA